MFFEHPDKAFLPFNQQCRCPCVFRPHFLREHKGRCGALAFEVGVFLLGEVVVAGRGVLVPVQRNQIGEAVRPAIALVLDDVVGHQEVAQEAQRLFLFLLQRLGDLLPLVLELGELRLFDLREQQVLEQVHRVQAHAALVDGLKNLQRAAHVGGYLDEHDVCGEIEPILLELGGVVVVVFQITVQG